MEALLCRMQILQFRGIKNVSSALGSYVSFNLGWKSSSIFLLLILQLTCLFHLFFKVLFQLLKHLNTHLYIKNLFVELPWSESEVNPTTILSQAYVRCNFSPCLYFVVIGSMFLILSAFHAQQFNSAFVRFGIFVDLLLWTINVACTRLFQSRRKSAMLFCSAWFPFNRLEQVSVFTLERSIVLLNCVFCTRVCISA